MFYEPENYPGLLHGRLAMVPLYYSGAKKVYKSISYPTKKEERGM